MQQPLPEPTREKVIVVHYAGTATEALVLKHDMLDFFADLGLSAEFVPQLDPWR